MRAIHTSFLFASDLHGSTLCFKNLIDEAIRRKVTAVIVGGDLTGKYPTFIITKHGSWEAEFAGSLRKARSRDELTELKEDIENIGSYPVEISHHQKLELDQQRKVDANKYQQTINDILFKEEVFRLKNWFVFADKKLRSQNIRLLLMCGNDDAWGIDSTIAEFPYIENPDLKLVKLESHLVIGESAASETPLFSCPRNMTESALQKRLEPKVAQIPEPAMKRAIFVFHCPPKNTSIDQAFSTDGEGRTNVSAGHAVSISAGSEAVKAAITVHQPMLSLHGHIHEADGFCYIGRTLCLNPGSEYDKGVLRAWHVTLKDESVLDFQTIIV